MRDVKQYKVAIPAGADAFAGTKTGTTVDMKNWARCTCVIQKSTGLTGTSTVIVEKCSNTGGSNNEAIPFLYRRINAAVLSGLPGAWTQATAAGFTTTAGSDEVYEIVIDQQIEGLAEGDKRFVRVVATEVVDSPVIGAALYILEGGRYGDQVAA